MRSYDGEGENWEVIFELRLSGSSRHGADALIQALKTLPGVRSVSLLGSKAVPAHLRAHRRFWLFSIIQEINDNWRFEYKYRQIIQK